MNYSKLLKATTDPKDVGDGCYTDADGTLKNAEVLYPIVDMDITDNQRELLIAAERASGMSEEDIAYFYPKQ